jgi:hypothetical protein
MNILQNLEDFDMILLFGLPLSSSEIYSEIRDWVLSRPHVTRSSFWVNDDEPDPCPWTTPAPWKQLIGSNDWSAAVLDIVRPVRSSLLDSVANEQQMGKAWSRILWIPPVAGKKRLVPVLASEAGEPLEQSDAPGRLVRVLL